MDESTSIAAVTRTHLSAMSTKQLLCLRRLILEADKPYPLPPNEEQECALIKEEILSRVVEPARKAFPTMPHTDLQVLGGAVTVAATVALGFVSSLWWLHALLATAICCWLALHWQYLFPGKP